MLKPTEQLCFCALSRDAGGGGRGRKRIGASVMSIQSVPEEDGADDVRVAVKDDDDSGQSSRFSKQDKGSGVPFGSAVPQGAFAAGSDDAEEQVLVLLDQGASDGSLIPAEAGQMPAGITWVTVCQADCLTAEDLCVALKSGFDRVYLQLSADVTRLAGQLQRVEAAALRLGPGQVVSLFAFGRRAACGLGGTRHAWSCGRCRAGAAQGHAPGRACDFWRGLHVLRPMRLGLSNRGAVPWGWPSECGRRCLHCLRRLCCHMPVARAVTRPQGQRRRP